MYKGYTIHYIEKRYKMTSFEQRMYLHQLQLEKIKALDIALKAIKQAQADYNKIVEYYNKLGV